VIDCRHSGLVQENQETSIVDEVDAHAKLFRQDISCLHRDKSNWSELSGHSTPKVMFDDNLSLSSRTAENAEADMISEDVQMEEHVLSRMIINFSVNILANTLCQMFEYVPMSAAMYQINQHLLIC